MRIMVVAPGHSIHTKRFIEAILSKGHQVVGVCEKNPFPDERENFCFAGLPRLQSGSRIIHMVFDSFLGHKSVEHMIIRIAGLMMRKLWLRYRSNVVHLLWLDGRANVCLSGGLKPLVISCWGSDINQYFIPNADSSNREQCKKAILGADMIICDSGEVIEKCRVIAGEHINVKSLHMGVDTKLFCPKDRGIRETWRMKLNIPLNSTVLLSARAWHPMYRHHEILNAFAQAVRITGKDLYLILKTYNKENYADNLHYEDEMKKQAESLGIAEKIRWLGKVPYAALPEIYATSDIVVNFPQMDSLGITLMEAALCEKIIVTNMLPCYKDTFVERFAILASAENVESLASALVHAVNSPPSSNILNAAREVVKQMYDGTAFSEKLNQINEELARR